MKNFKLKLLFIQLMIFYDTIFYGIHVGIFFYKYKIEINLDILWFDIYITIGKIK